MRLPLLVPALLAAGCVTDTRDAGTDAFDAAKRNAWQSGGGAAPPKGGNPLAPGGKDVGADDVFDAPAPDPADVVQVPVQNYLPIDAFFDHEGYLLGDRVEIDCSFEPFKARLAALAFNDDSGKFVARTESRVGDVHEVRLLNLDQGSMIQASRLPRATFGSLRTLREEGSPVANVRPFFEFVGTREIVVRFHMRTSREQPVFFRARAIGTAAAADPATQRLCAYVNANRRKLVRGPELPLDMAIRRGAAGNWETILKDPGESGDR